MDSLHPCRGEVEPVELLSQFRLDFYVCLCGERMGCSS
jgi:hypothetical protein